MTTIPDEIMEQAREAYANLPIIWDGQDEQGCIDIIASALLAAEKRGEEMERERCARIVDEIGSALMDRTPAEAAKAIRAGN